MPVWKAGSLPLPVTQRYLGCVGRPHGTPAPPGVRHADSREALGLALESGRGGSCGREKGPPDGCAGTTFHLHVWRGGQSCPQTGRNLPGEPASSRCPGSGPTSSPVPLKAPPAEGGEALEGASAWALLAQLPEGRTWQVGHGEWQTPRGFKQTRAGHGGRWYLMGGSQRPGRPRLSQDGCPARLLAAGP